MRDYNKNYDFRIHFFKKRKEIEFKKRRYIVSHRDVYIFNILIFK